MINAIKTIISVISNTLGLSKLYYTKLNKKYRNNYVRVINYHDVEDDNLVNFEKQINLIQKYYKVISIEELKDFLNKKISFNEKPAMLISFDDGKMNNYNASKVLDKYNIKGTFFVSSEKIDNDDQNYLKIKELKEMINNGHYISNHTASHHRFSLVDSDDVVNYELITSNHKLNNALEINNDCFCWCGGETNVYTKKAFDVIKENFNYAFTTCTQITTVDTNPLFINRTNVEARWNLSLTKFQILGLWDLVYKNKEKNVKQIIGLTK